MTKLAQATDVTVARVLELHLYDAYFTQNVGLMCQEGVNFINENGGWKLPGSSK